MNDAYRYSVTCGCGATESQEIQRSDSRALAIGLFWKRHEDCRKVTPLTAVIESTEARTLTYDDLTKAIDYFTTNHTYRPNLTRRNALSEPIYGDGA